MKLNELNIKPEIVKALEDMEFQNFTEIQAEAIPHAISSRDVLGQAQTGTGKTAAFVIPILEQLDTESKDLQAIILAPTRELAIQICNEIDKIGKYMNVRTLSVYGGEPIDRQMKLLKNNPHIVAATPGRCLDLLKRRKLKLNNIKYFVLDEVDEMLNMGFIEDVEEITKAMPKYKQTLLFSATLPKEIKKICDTYLVDPAHIKVDAKSLTVDKVTQRYIVVKKKLKNEVLDNLLLLGGKQKVIVFTQTKRDCDELYDFLKEKRYRVNKIHGDIVQKQRTKTIEQFRDGQFDILVATDVVARGIDIDGIELVVNYELPQDIEYYIHRIGRTGRGNSEKGDAITLVTPAVYKKEFRTYPKRLKCDITEMERPTYKQVIEKLQHQYLAKMQTELANPELDIDETFLNMSAMLLAETSEYLLVPYLLEQLYPQLSFNKVQEEAKLREEKRERERRENNRNRDGRGGRDGRRNRDGRDGRGGRDGRRNRDGRGGRGGRDGRRNRDNDQNNFKRGRGNSRRRNK